MPRKRTHDEMVASEPPPESTENILLKKIRNMWEFASVYEFMHLFGSVIKIEKLDIEDLENECTKSEPSDTLDNIGLQLLKWISSHRGLNLEIWDEYTRRQYQTKAPTKFNPYGEEEEPKKFRNFDIFTKIRVLHQLTVWTFWNPDKIRQSLHEVKETQQFDDWQAHPIGWDRYDRTYFHLAGNRLYRRIDPPIPAAESKKTKYTSKKAQAQRRRERSLKRRRVADSSDGDTEMAEADETLNETQINGEGSATQHAVETDPDKIDTFGGGYKWECVAINLDGYNNFLAATGKTKDPNERFLRSKIESEMMPELQAREERRQRKIEARLREIQLQEKMQGAKRSGRLAAKQERERGEAQAADEERKRRALLAAAHREEDKKHQMENERQFRMQTREQRIKEREYKRVLMEEQLARDSEEEARVEQEGVRGSRHLKERIEKRRKELEELSEAYDEWVFDCSGCGIHGKNVDDGEHSIACERCNVWQHSKCLGISKAAAERDDFHFICSDCKRKEEEANRPKLSLKFKVGQSSSPPLAAQSALKQEQESPVKERLVSVDVPSANGEDRPFVPGSVVDGQFYPAPGPPTHQPLLSQAFAPVTQPSMPGYAMKHANRPIPYSNGVPPQYSYNATNGNPPHGRLPGSGHAQSLHNQVTFPNHAPHQQPGLQAYSQSPVPPNLRPASSHAQTPRPASSHSQANGHSSPMRQRIPSPMINRPTMSPTQGNTDVGPIAGVPGSSPILQHVSMATPHTNGHRTPQNNVIPQSTPNEQPFSQNSSFSSSQNNMQPTSGLSPTKLRTSATPFAQPPNVPQKAASFTTPSSSFNGQARSVSGTPIFPPTESFAPSPQQLNREPVPTPSKQPSPPHPGVDGHLPNVGEVTSGSSAAQDAQVSHQNHGELQKAQPQSGTTVQ